jgi:hypothetical protein
VGQVLAGHKNGLEIELNGREGSLGWKQERQNELWLGYHDRPNAVMSKDPAMMSPGAASYAHLSAGHQEGWSDAFCNVIADVYHWVRTGERRATVCSFEDATGVCEVIEAMLKSHAAGGVWQDVNRANVEAAAEEQEVEIGSARR